jgi:putative ubiquitin-RnfH superfamily antitoxin RatB of RatAB toxin-antitoxin module
VIDEARKEMNKQLDTKRIEILKAQLSDPNIQGKKRENRQKELNKLVSIYGEV